MTGQPQAHAGAVTFSFGDSPEMADELLALSASTKQNTESGFLDYLHDLGRKSADQWLEGAASRVGVEPGIDLSAEIGYRLEHEVPALAGVRAKKELKTPQKRQKPKRARKAAV